MPQLFLMGNARAPEGKKKIWNSVKILNWFAFSTHKIDLMGKIIYFTFEKKSNTKNIRSNIRRKLRHFFTGTEKPLDFNSKLQKIDKVVKDKCPFNAHCPMGNARATKFLKGHCPILPMPPFFLMGIARVCPCPKILPVKQHTAATSSGSGIRVRQRLAFFRLGSN